MSKLYLFCVNNDILVIKEKVFIKNADVKQLIDII